MAKIVLGMGSSHGPMLSTPPDMWHLRAGADRKNPKHFYRGEMYDFSKLLAARQPGFAGATTPEMMEPLSIGLPLYVTLPLTFA